MLAIELVHDRESKNPAPELVAAVCEEALRNGLLLMSAGHLLQRGPRARPADDRRRASSTRRSASGSRRSSTVARRATSRDRSGQFRAMVGELIADRYELEELVGTGGMSSVYRARDRLLERTVAIKILHEHYSRDEDYVERFRREARAAAQLPHPNIVTVIDRGEAGGRQFIVFEYVDGENLKQLVESEGRLPVRDGARARDRDRPRARVRARERARPPRREAAERPARERRGEGDRLRDRARSPTCSAGLTQTGTVLGTSEYIAPEQASGRPVDALCDVYSLGVVLYELLAGEPPYSGDELRRRRDAARERSGAEHLARPARRAARGSTPRSAGRWRRIRTTASSRWTSSSPSSQSCLELLGEPDADRTAVMRPAVPGRPRVAPKRRRRRWLSAPSGRRGARRRLPPAPTSDSRAGIGGGGGGSRRCASSRRTRTTRHGDGQEHDELVPNATDGDRRHVVGDRALQHGVTSANLKDGVGIVLDAGNPVRPRGAHDRSPTRRAYVADVEAGASSNGPFDTVSARRGRSATGRRSRSRRPGARRYYLLWITRLAPGVPAHACERSDERLVRL